MKFIIFLCVFHLTRAEENVEGIAESGKLPEKSSLPTWRDYVETKNLNLFLNLMRRMNLVGLHEIPPFDPFTKDIERVEINGIPNVKGWVSLSNLTVTGIDRFDFPELLLQSESLKDPEQKLLTFVQTLPRLDFEAEVIGQYTMDNMKVDVDLQVAGYSTGITNTGQLGLSKLYLDGEKFGGSLYQIDSYKIKTHMDTLRLKVLNSRRSRSTITEGDVIAAVVSAIVTSELNKILWGVTSDQVDAFLRTGKPDQIEIDLNNIDGKSKSGELAEPEGEINEWESSNLAMVVELTRRIAAVGMHSVPIFSPYKAQLEPVILDPSLVGSPVIMLSDVVVKGLESFENEVLTLQPANTSRGYSKLLKLKENFASLSATANVVVRLGDGDTSASVSAIATNVVNNGTMEIDLVDVPNDEHTFGDLAYQITSFDLENRIQHLKLKLTNIKHMNSNIGPWNRDLVQKLADGLSLAVGHAAQNQLNVILRSYTSLQVDAFLDAGIL